MPISRLPAFRAAYMPLMPEICRLLDFRRCRAGRHYALRTWRWSAVSFVFHHYYAYVMFIHVIDFLFAAADKTARARAALYTMSAFMLRGVAAAIRA